MKLKHRFKFRRFLAMAAGSLILAVALLWLFHPQTARAFESFLGIVETRYPAMVATRIDNCTLCHISTVPLVLNPFGTAFQENGQNAAALDAIANLDSDGDGWTNLQEIRALTFPGDPTDQPIPKVRVFIPEAVEP